jgi:hypothetical protein
VRIELQAFDSGRLAPRVGVVHLSADEDVNEEQILERSRADRFDLVSLSLPDLRPLRLFRHVGTLLEHVGMVADLADRLAGLRSAGEVRNVVATDWPNVEALVAVAPPNRFGRDPRLAPSAVRRHKVDMLRTYAGHHPEHTLVSTEGGAVVGLQLSWPRGEDIVLYELMTEPGPAQAFRAIGLLRENVRRLRRDAPAAERVVAWIYEHNTRSLAFFAGLGMHPTGRASFHHHLWPERDLDLRGT